MAGLSVFDLQASISVDTSQLVDAVNRASAAGSAAEKSIQSVSQSVNSAQRTISNAEREINRLSGSTGDADKELATLNNKLEVARNETRKAAQNVEYLRENFNSYAETTGTASDETQILYEALEKAERQLAACERAEQSAEANLNSYIESTTETADSAEDAAESSRHLGDEVKSSGDSAEESGNRFSGFADAIRSVSDIAGTAVNVVATAATAISGAVKAGVTAAKAATVDGVANLAQYGDMVDKQSQKLNISAEAYQEWDAIMRHSGTTVGVMTASMRTLVNAAQSDSAALKALGIAQEEALSMGQEELFSLVITRLQEMEDKTQRQYLATKLLGRGAMEFGALLNTSVEDTDKMRQTVHRLNGVLDDESVKASARFRDSLQDMQTGFTGLSRSLLSDFLPSFADVMDGITELFAQDADEAKASESIEKGLTSIADTVENTLPKILGIIDKVMEHADGLAPIVFNTFSAIADSVSKAFSRLDAGKMIETALQLIETGTKPLDSIGESLVNVFSTIASKAPDIIKVVGNAFSSVGGALWDSFISALDIISEGNTIEEVISTIGGFIENAIEKFTKDLPKIVSIITKILPKVTTAIFSNLGGIVDSVSNSLITIIPVLAEALVSNIEPLIQAGNKILITVIDALTKDDGLLDGFTDMITSVVNIITENIDPILLAVRQVALTVVAALNDPEVSSKLWSSAAEIMGSVIVGAAKILGSTAGFIAELTAAITELLLKVDWVNLIGETAKGIGDGLLRAFGFDTDELDKNMEEFGGCVYDTVQEYLENIALGWEIIGNGLTELKDKWITCWNDIKDNFSEAWDKIKSWIDEIPEKFTELVNSATTWGTDMIQNFVDGIVGKWNELTGKVADTATIIGDYLGFSEPEKGVLSNFHTYAPDMIDLFVKGIKDNGYKIGQAFDEELGISTDRMPRAEYSVASVGSEAAQSVSAQSNHLTINELHISYDGDMEDESAILEFVDKLIPFINEKLETLEIRDKRATGGTGL